MRRREFMAGLGGAAAWPLMARAQRPNLPVIGFLSARSPKGAEGLVAAFKEGLAETGYVSDQNVAIDYRWAEGQYELLPALAADLVSRRVALIAAFGGNITIFAAKAATTTIPIVFTSGADPVSSGLVPSISRPNGNLTGVYMWSGGLEAKRLALIRELVPSAAAVAVLVNPTPGAGADVALRDLERAAVDAGVRIEVVYARTLSELDSAFATIASSTSKALLVVADPFLNNERDKIVSLAARYSLAAIYDLRDFVVAGGLMSYGTFVPDTPGN